MEPHESAPATDARKRRKCWRFRRLASSPRTPNGSAAFLASTGIAPEDIRAAAREPGFLAGVLEHMLGDESLLIAFAASAGIDPAEVARARGALGRPRGTQRAVSACFCRDCLADAAAAGRALRRLRLAAAAAPRRARTRSPSPMSTATPSTPRSKSATIRRSPPSRSSSAAASAAWSPPPATSPAPSACRSAMPMFEALRLCPHARVDPAQHGEICRASAARCAR